MDLWSAYPPKVQRLPQLWSKPLKKPKTLTTDAWATEWPGAKAVHVMYEVVSSWDVVSAGFQPALKQQAGWNGNLLINNTLNQHCGHLVVVNLVYIPTNGNLKDLNWR
jgi:hypothetical protein